MQRFHILFWDVAVGLALVQSAGRAIILLNFDRMKPLNNAPFCPIATEYENDNPQNIHPVIILIFLAIKQN